MKPEILRLPEVIKLVGLSRAGIYKAMRQPPPHNFPTPVKLGKRAVGWRRADLYEWLDSRTKAEPEPAALAAADQ